MQKFTHPVMAGRGIYSIKRPLAPKRKLGFDLARGFTVLFIPMIHAVMLYGKPEVHDSVFGGFLSFIAEWPGAQLLMFLMGVHFSFSTKSLAYHLKRAVILFVSGYGLNLLKFVIPGLFHLAPASFVADAQFSGDRPVLVNFFLMGDILPFAGVAMAVLALLKRVRVGVTIAVVLAYFVILGSPLFFDLHHENAVVDYLLQLAGGQPWDVFFPVFPWLAYPLAGFAAGWLLRQEYASMFPVFVSGFTLFAGGFLMMLSPYRFPEASFYRTFPEGTIVHLGFVMVWVAVWDFVSKFFEPRRLQDTKGSQRFFVIRLVAVWDFVSKFFEPRRLQGTKGAQRFFVKGLVAVWGFVSKFFGPRRLQSTKSAQRFFVMCFPGLLQFCSRKITVIYLVQWPLICWLLPVVGYRSLGVWGSFLIGLLLTVAVLILTRLLSNCVT